VTGTALLSAHSLRLRYLPTKKRNFVAKNSTSLRSAAFSSVAFLFGPAKRPACFFRERVKTIHNALFHCHQTGVYDRELYAATSVGPVNSGAPWHLSSRPLLNGLDFSGTSSIAVSVAEALKRRPS